MLDAIELKNNIKTEMAWLFEEYKNELSAELVQNKYADVLNEYIYNNADVIFDFIGVNPGGTPIVLSSLLGKIELNIKLEPSPNVTVWKALIINNVSMSTSYPNTIGFNPEVISLGLSSNISGLDIKFTTDDAILDVCTEFISYIKSLTPITIDCDYITYSGTLTMSNIT